MKIVDLCNKNTVTIEQNKNLYDVACLMEENNVGCIVVTKDNSEDFKPVGIITDRDLVVKVMANNKDYKETKVAEIMSKDLLILEGHTGIQEAIEEMNKKGVRRAPILKDKKLCGVVAVDDLIELIADELNSLSDLVKKQVSAA